jgi:hypothetical protein
MRRPPRRPRGRRATGSIASPPPHSREMGQWLSERLGHPFKLNNEINAGLADPRIKARFTEFASTVFPGSPLDFGKFMAEEMDKWGKVV